MAQRIDFSPAKEAIMDRHLDLLLDNKLLDVYSLRWAGRTSRFATACWTFARVAGESTHVIVFGEKLAERCTNIALLAEYSILYYRHEVRHSLATDRNLQGLQRECSKRKIPFRLLNVAEDARIEAIDRKEYGPFDWLKFEAPIEADNPVDLLLEMIQADGALEVCRARPGSVCSEYFDRVGDFYHRFAAAISTHDLLPILEEWINEFGSTPDVECELSQAAALQNDPVLQQLFEDTREFKESEADQAPRENDINPVAMKGDGNHNFIGEDKTAVLDVRRVEELTEILRSAFRDGTEIAPSLFGKRMQMKAAMREADRVYRRLTRTESTQTRRVHVYRDCSSSMAGEEIVTEGAHLLAALDRLATEGRIEGTLTLTAGHDEMKHFETFHLPVGSEIIERIPSDGCCECFENALAKTEANFDYGDLVIAYTDGRINDAPVHKSYWHRKGVYSIGCYVGEDQKDRLARWFDAGVCRSTAEGLAVELATLLHERYH